MTARVAMAFVFMPNKSSMDIMRRLSAAKYLVTILALCIVFLINKVDAQVRTFSVPGSQILSVAVYGDDVYGGGDNFLRQWKLSNTSFQFNYQSVSAAVDVVVTDTKLFVAQQGNGIYKFNIGSGLSVYQFPLGGIQTLTMTVKDDYLFSGHCNGDYTVRQWQISTGQQVRLFGTHDGNVNSLSLNGDFLFSSSADGTVKQWRITDGILKQTFNIGMQGFAVTTGADYVFVSTGGPVYHWRISTGRLIAVLNGHTSNTWAINIFGDYLFTGDDLGVIRQWQISTSQAVRVINGHSGNILRLAISGQYLFSSSFDGTIKQWEIAELPRMKTVTTTIGGGVVTRSTVQFTNTVLANVATARLTAPALVTVYRNSPVTSVSQQTVAVTETITQTTVQLYLVTQTTTQAVISMQTMTSVVTSILP